MDLLAGSARETGVMLEHPSHCSMANTRHELTANGFPDFSDVFADVGKSGTWM